MSSAVLLRASGLTKRFGEAVAVRELDLEIAEGEYFCILGPSGSGKSTLLRMLAGFDLPDEGQIHLGGESLAGVPPERRDVNTVFQGYALFPHLSVYENVAFGLRVRRVSREELRRRVVEALELVGLSDFGSRSPASLSGGEQQRIALARALVNRPSVLLLDEPLAALDRKLRQRMQAELARIQRDTGIAFIHVTHDQEEALRLGDRLAVMKAGRILRVGTPAEVYLRPGTAFVADFLGSANLFRARSSPEGVVLPDGTLFLRTGGAPPASSGGAIRHYAIRPEVIVIAGREGADGSPDDPMMLTGPGHVAARRRIGAVEELTVQAGSLQLLVHARTTSAEVLPEPGEPVILRIHADDLLALDAEAEDSTEAEDSLDGER